MFSLLYNYQDEISKSLVLFFVLVFNDTVLFQTQENLRFRILSHSVGNSTGMSGFSIWFFQLYPFRYSGKG